MKYIRYMTILIIFSVSIYASKVIKINLSTQKVYAIENGEIVFSGNVSTGKYKHRTPRGTFRVLEKKRFHISSKYPEPNGGAKMPYMLRITRYGVAIHQGYLPGYPASHGCIRVSKSTAKKLWYWVKIRTKVIIYGDPTDFEYARKQRLKRYKKIKHKKRYAKHKKRSFKRKYVENVKRNRNVQEYEVIEVYDSW